MSWHNAAILFLPLTMFIIGTAFGKYLEAEHWLLRSVDNLGGAIYKRGRFYYVVPEEEYSPYSPHRKKD